VFLPGSTLLEKDGTFTNAERRINRVRKVMAPRAGLADWEVTQAIANAYGLPMHYTHPSEIMDEIARTTPTFAGVSFAKLDAEGSVQWPCNEKAPHGTPVMHIDGFVRGKGRFFVTEYVATDEKIGPRFPLLLTTGRILSQYNVGAQTRRTANVMWHKEDLLEIHPHDAEQRGIKQGDLVRLASRVGATTLHAHLTDRVAPGGIQGHRGAGRAKQWPDRVAAELRRAQPRGAPYRARAGEMMAGSSPARTHGERACARDHA
jgi:formate dehydrogenase major subunit